MTDPKKVVLVAHLLRFAADAVRDYDCGHVAAGAYEKATLIVEEHLLPQADKDAAWEGEGERSRG